MGAGSALVFRLKSKVPSPPHFKTKKNSFPSICNLPSDFLQSRIWDADKHLFNDYVSWKSTQRKPHFTDSRKGIPTRSFHVYCPICVKFGIDLYVTRWVGHTSHVIVPQ